MTYISWSIDFAFYHCHRNYLYTLRNGAGQEYSCACSSFQQFLAHLSQRLTRWAYSIPMVCRPFVAVHTFKLEYLWSQLANLEQILCVASPGWGGGGCIKFWGRLDQNSGFHGNRKPPWTYSGENGVSTFSGLLLIQSFLYSQVKRTQTQVSDRCPLGYSGTCD